MISLFFLRWFWNGFGVSPSMTGRWSVWIVLLWACTACVNAMVQRLGGGHGSPGRGGSWSHVRAVGDCWRSARMPELVWQVGSSSAGLTFTGEDKWWWGRLPGDWVFDSFTNVDGLGSDDDEVICSWGAGDIPEKVCPAGVTVLPSPSTFPLAGASSCPAGLWLAAGVSWLGPAVVGVWLLSCEWQSGHVSWT